MIAFVVECIFKSTSFVIEVGAYPRVARTVQLRRVPSSPSGLVDEGRSHRPPAENKSQDARRIYIAA